MVRSGKNFACTICKKKGLPLDECLKVMKVGDTSNVNTHLKEQHKKEKEETLEKKKKRGNTNNTLSSGSILLTINKKKSKTKKKSTASMLAEEELEHRVFKFVSNAALPTNILANENFHDITFFSERVFKPRVNEKSSKQREQQQEVTSK